MTIILYCLALIAVGWWCRREARDTEGYFLASRRLSSLQVGFSLTSAAFGGSAILVASQMVYSKGLAGLWFSGSVALGFAVLGVFFAQRVRQSGAHSLADYIGHAYGPHARRIASALVVVVQITFFALTVKSFALITTPLFGQSRWALTGQTAFEVLITAVFLIYTLWGGHKAVAITDYLQMTTIAAGLLGVMLPVALVKTDFAQLPGGYLRLPLSPGMSPTFILNMIVMMGLPGIVGGDVFSKMLSAADARAARRGALLAAAGFGTFALAVALLALCARVHLPTLATPDNMQVSMLLMGRQILPAALFEIVTVTFLSALLSTGDSVLLTGTTVLALDVLRLGKSASVAAHRAITVALALAGLGLALYTRELLTILRFGYTLLVASLVIPVLITLIGGTRWRATPAVGISGMIAGLLGALAWKLALTWGWIDSAIDPAVIGVAAASAAMGVGMLRPESLKKASPRVPRSLQDSKERQRPH